MPLIATALTPPKKALRNRAERLAAAMIDAVDSRLAVAATPAASMKLFTGLTAAYAGATFVANTANWLHDLRPQLNGFHMKAGGWTQSYGAIPLGDRYLLSCSHNGPDIGEALTYVKADGTVFNTTVSKWINDNVAKVSSDTKQAYTVDLSVYVTAHALPEWVCRVPIVNLPAATRDILNFYSPPTVGVTQGNWQSGPAGAYGLYDTPDNRMLRVAALNGTTPSSSLRTPFHHHGKVGDSGTPLYALIADTLYLLGVTLSEGGSGLYVCDHMAEVNSLIARGAAAAGIAPITVSAVTVNP